MQKPHKHKHSHDHEQDPLSAFFGCCLTEDPTPISAKIQQLREQLPETHNTELTVIPGQNITITKDMIIADVMTTFPITRQVFEDLHPLGLLSPSLDKISIELFLSDLQIDPDQICAELTNLIND